ncbi:MAG: DUF4340 domain-containing protein, partial [Anaerolineae bacterium]
GQSETCLTSELSTWDANASASSWIDTRYQSVAQEDINLMRLENASGTFVFEKNGEGNWSLADLGEGETLDQAQVRTVLGRAASVRMKEPLGKEGRPSYGMDDPNAVVALETAEGAVTLRVGAKDIEEASYVVKSSESDYYVLVSQTSLAALVENGREAFLEQPPTPEAESPDS